MTTPTSDANSKDDMPITPDPITPKSEVCDAGGNDPALDDEREFNAFYKANGGSHDSIKELLIIKNDKIRAIEQKLRIEGNCNSALERQIQQLKLEVEHLQNQSDVFSRKWIDVLADNAEAKKILWKELDRDKGDETLLQLACIASNGLKFRDDLNKELKSQLAQERQLREAAEKVIQSQERFNAVSNTSMNSMSAGEYPIWNGLATDLFNAKEDYLKLKAKAVPVPPSEDGKSATP